MRRLGLSFLDIAGLTLLFALIAGLTIWLARAAESDGAARIAPAPWKPEMGPAAQLGLPSPSQRSAFKQTLERPVFFESRRPYLAPPAPPPPKPVQPVTAPAPPVADPAFRVTGIAIIGGARQAFLHSPENADGVWTREGGAISGWKVSRITAETVTVEQSGRSFELNLYENRIQDEIASDTQQRPNLR
jgi:hypothetical protein